MKIDSYNVGMESVRTHSSVLTRKLSLITAGKIVTNSFANTSLNFGKEQFMTDDNEEHNGNTNVSNAPSLRDIMNGLQNPLRTRIKSAVPENDMRDIENVRYRFIQYLWQIFFGKDASENLSKEFGFQSDTLSESSEFTSEHNQPALTLNAIRETYYEEQQELSFNCGGFVSTSDGRQIDFSLNVEMSSSFSAYYREEGLPLPAMCDPLVMNFSGDIAELEDTTFFFDLDADGKEDKISHLNSGSGFLALDKNNDGSINDGSELFGAKSGNGFSELSAFDTDNNGWIDENDEIFDKLKIWVKTASGENVLYSLKDKNVGAIFLGNVNTGHTLRGNDGSTRGMLRNSGFFLYEDGSGVGTVSHIDMATG